MNDAGHNFDVTQSKALEAAVAEFPLSLHLASPRMLIRSGLEACSPTAVNYRTTWWKRASIVAAKVSLKHWTAAARKPLDCSLLQTTRAGMAIPTNYLDWICDGQNLRTAFDCSDTALASTKCGSQPCKAGSITKPETSNVNLCVTVEILFIGNGHVAGVFVLIFCPRCLPSSTPLPSSNSNQPPSVKQREFIVKASSFFAHYAPKNKTR
ncbi:hypothetical protein BBAD15_g3793 [Beauveria bassiana D1-5]|uniref:Uncharacterized protein n=1 Tax=Beauveria bassiana D1-5 TaxID=1245745 RepID=A0A0A2VTA9_BEABA|nr:hypothetical protein BBAD15_g3793 [Beauveria bassiana D1-5]